MRGISVVSKRSRRQTDDVFGAVFGSYQQYYEMKAASSAISLDMSTETCPWQYLPTRPQKSQKWKSSNMVEKILVKGEAKRGISWDSVGWTYECSLPAKNLLGISTWVRLFLYRRILYITNTRSHLRFIEMYIKFRLTTATVNTSGLDSVFEDLSQKRSNTSPKISDSTIKNSRPSQSFRHIIR